MRHSKHTYIKTTGLKMNDLSQIPIMLKYHDMQSGFHHLYQCSFHMLITFLSPFIQDLSFKDGRQISKKI